MKTFSVLKITWSPVIILFLFKWLPWLYTKCNQIWWPYWNSDSNDLLSSNIWLSPLQPCFNFTVQSNSFLNEYYCVVLHWITLLQTQHACFVMITTVWISSNLQPTDCRHHHPAIITWITPYLINACNEYTYIRPHLITRKDFDYWGQLSVCERTEPVLVAGVNGIEDSFNMLLVWFSFRHLRWELS